MPQNNKLKPIARSYHLKQPTLLETIMEVPFPQNKNPTLDTNTNTCLPVVHARITNTSSTEPSIKANKSDPSDIWNATAFIVYKDS